MLQIYSNSKINICFTKSYGVGTRNQIKNKIFDITMCGGFLLCEYVDGIEDFFDVNKEIVCFHDCEDALNKIRYYMGNDNEREQIALKGKERSVNNYSQQRLFEKVFNVLERGTQFEPKRFFVNNLQLNMPVRPDRLAAQFHLRWAEVMKTEGFDEWRWREEYELAYRYDRSLEGRFDQISDIALTDKGLRTKSANKHLIMLINGYRVGTPSLPTGIGYIAQAIGDAGFDYEVCDVNIHSDDQIVEQIKIIKPAYVGLGTMTFEVESNYQLLQTIRKSIPDVIIILGGPHAIAAGNEIFEECSAIDLVIQGEGEDSLVKLLNGEPLHTIPGVIARHAIEASPLYVPLNITKIAFPRYHKFALEKYGNIINIASSRGCVYKCTFCGAPKFLGKKWRAFSVSRMIEEFEYWYGRYYRNFYFSDSLFALDKQRVIDFCAYIVESGYKDVVFTVDGARADHLTLEVLQHMKKANVRFLTIGVESVNDKTLEFFQKGETFNQIDTAISIADSLGFDITVYLIIGAPGESYNDALKSIYYPLKFKNIVKSIVSKLMPIKGTPYYQYAIDHGLVANPKLCYPLHEVSGFNKRIDTHNPVEEIWEALYPEIDRTSKFLDTRNGIKKYLEQQGLPDIEVDTLNALTQNYFSSLPGNTDDDGNQIVSVDTNLCDGLLQKKELFISVIIPTRNRAAFLYNALESLTTQSYQKNSFEVIVVDNGSKDETAAVCEHFRFRLLNFRCIHVPHPGLHIARHAGLKEAIGEVLVYADDDIEAQPTWLEGIAESFVDPKVALVGGKILPKFEVPPPEWVAELSSRTDSGWALGWYSILDFGDTAHEIQHEYVWGCNFSIRKEVLKKTGGFHPDGFPQEMIKYRGDGETAVSVAVREMGLKAMYNPKAAIFHVVGAERMTTDYIYQRAFNQGISDSFSSIRKTQALADPLPYALVSSLILNTVSRGFADGFNYHQQMVKSDERLREWVLKDDYLEEDDLLQEISIPINSNITVTTDAATNNVLPKIIQISISDACNFKCTSCWIHGPNVAADDNNLEALLFRDSKPQVMDVKVYERLIADLKKNPGPVSLSFCGKGEPTLHPRFLDMVKFAYINGLPSNVTTNGSGLTIDILKALREMQVTLNISLNAYSQESHQIFSNIQKDFFTSIIEMIRFFRAAEYIGFISLSFVIGSHNIGSIKRMAELSADILPFGSAINFYPEWTHSGNPENRVSSGQIVTLLEELTDIIDILCNSNISHNLNLLPYVLYGISVSKEADEPTRDYYMQNPCSTVDNFMVVLADGRAVPCCRSAYVYGNINERSIFDIWSDPKSIEFRFKAKNIATFKKEAPCSHCFSCDHIMGHEYFITRYRSAIDALMSARQ